MADNVVVSNAPASSNTDIPVRTSETASGKQIQHVRLDLGSGSSESPASGTVPMSAASLPLPTGAATEATLSTLNGKVTACNTGAIAGTVTANAGTNLNTSALALESGGNLASVATKLAATGGSAQQVQGPSASGASITTGNLFPCGFKDLFNNGVIPTGLDASGVIVMGVLPLDVSLNLQDFSASGEAYSLVGATANSSATARYIALTSSGEVLTLERENTSSTSNVSGSASSVSLLASNTARKKAKFYNDSSAILYLKEGTTASTTSFTTKLFPEGYYETTYSGAIDGIWSSATGAVRITELT